MFTRFPWLDYLIWCLLRFMLYMFLIVFAGINYNDLPKYTLEFQEKIEEFSKLSNIHNQTYFPDDLEQLECTALVTSGKFYNAQTEAELLNGFNKSIETSKNVEAKIILPN